MTDEAIAVQAPKPTKETYDQFQRAYESLNTALFEGALPNCLITLQRRTGTYGYFSRARFAREDGEVSDEIALNPAHFQDRSVAEVLATLAHEMVHLWQHAFGKPGRGRYHNREWAEKMKTIGLQPTDSDAGDGKETGERVHHRIVEGGPFDRAVARLTGRGFSITWKDNPDEPDETDGEVKKKPPSGASKSGKRVRYDCPECGQHAWAKFEANIKCGEHDLRMQPGK